MPATTAILVRPDDITHAGTSCNWSVSRHVEPLAHRHYDTFELPEAPDRLCRIWLVISFSIDREGNIATWRLRWRLVKEIVFSRHSELEMA